MNFFFISHISYCLSFHDFHHRRTFQLTYSRFYDIKALLKSFKFVQRVTKQLKIQYQLLQLALEYIL